MHLSEVKCVWLQILNADVTCGCGCSPGPALHGLPVEDLERPAGPRVDLVIHHVLQALVVGRPQEHLGVQLAAREPVVQHLQYRPQQCQV